MEKVRPWCGRPSDRGRLKEQNITGVCGGARSGGPGDTAPVKGQGALPPEAECVLYFACPAKGVFRPCSSGSKVYDYR